MELKGSVRLESQSRRTEQNKRCQFKPKLTKLKAFFAAAVMWGVVPIWAGGFLIRIGGVAHD